jgi:ribosomal protein L35AE/L33A
MPSRLSKRRGFSGFLAAVALILPSCAGDGNFTMLGYTTAPNYDCGIHTVYVPIFHNVTFARGLEFQLTQAVIREIESKTPFKVVSCREEADTELLGKIVSWNKQLINFNQLNEVREAETYLGVELVWRDMRQGQVGEVLATTAGPTPGEPTAVVSPGAHVAPVLVQGMGTFIPELGGSMASAEKQMVDRLAVQIVSMMERPW